MALVWGQSRVTSEYGCCCCCCCTVGEHAVEVVVTVVGIVVVVADLEEVVMGKLVLEQD